MHLQFLFISTSPLGVGCECHDKGQSILYCSRFEQKRLNANSYTGRLLLIIAPNSDDSGKSFVAAATYFGQLTPSFLHLFSIGENFSDSEFHPTFALRSPSIAQCGVHYHKGGGLP